MGARLGRNTRLRNQACASAVASVLNGYCLRNTDIKVNLIGGTLYINWTNDGNVLMTGPAAEVCTGEIDV